MCLKNIWPLVHTVWKHRHRWRAGQCLSWLQAHSMLESSGKMTSLQSGQSHFMAKSNLGILIFMQSKNGPRDPVARVHQITPTPLRLTQPPGESILLFPNFLLGKGAWLSCTQGHTVSLYPSWAHLVVAAALNHTLLEIWTSVCIWVHFFHSPVFPSP